MLATVLLLGLLTAAAVTDILRHKVYNWTTYPGILAAAGLNGLGSAALAAGVADRPSLESLGWIGLGDSLGGFLACGLVLLVCFVVFQVGGGDVKLLAMIGAFLGPQAGIEAMLWTFVLGGCAGLIVLVWRLGPWRLLGALVRQVLWVARLARFSPLTPDERAQLQPPLYLAPSALAAVAIVQFALLERFGL